SAHAAKLLAEAFSSPGQLSTSFFGRVGIVIHAPAVVKADVSHFLGKACKGKYSSPVHYDRHATCRHASGINLAPKVAPSSPARRGLEPVPDRTPPPDPQSQPPRRSH